MNKLYLLTLVAVLWLGVAAAAEAQVAHVTYYQPATVYHAPPPAVAVTSYYTPAVPVVAYRPAPAVVHQPIAEVRTRYRPILGGTVSRVRYGTVPVVVY